MLLCVGPGDIQPMDVILGIDGTEVKDMSNEQITAILQGMGPQFTLTVGRSELHGPFPRIRRGVQVTRKGGESFGAQLIHTDKEAGTMVILVQEGGPFANAGVHAGDVIYAVNNQDVSMLNDTELGGALVAAGETFTMIVGQHADPESFSTAERVFHLKKDPTLGYGLKVITEEDQAGQHHRILSVLPNSPADAIANMLKLGDRIVSIDGQDMTSVDHDALLAALKPDEIEIVVVEDHRDIVDDDSQLSGVVLFTKSATIPGPGDACGLVLEKRPNLMGVRIADIQPNSPAAYTGFAIGDVMYDINGHPMLRSQLNEVYAAVTQFDPIEITVCEPDVIDSIHVVKVNREEGSPLGIAVVSDETGAQGHRIQEVTPGSAAGFTNSVFVGDKILYINGIVAANSQHEDVVKMLSAYNNLELVLLTDNADMPEKCDALRTLATQNPELKYTFSQDGVHAVNVMQRRGEVGIRIAAFAPATCGLQVGDCVVDFNGQSVAGMSVAEVKSMMRTQQGTFGTLPHQLVDPLSTALRAIVFTSDEVKASLGIQLCDDEDGNGARILEIGAESPANNTELYIGDRLMKINETEVNTLPHTEVLDALKRASTESETVTWTVAFDYEGLSMTPENLNQSNVSDVVAGTTREVVLVKGKGGLGITLMNDAAPIQIFEVAPDSIADKTNQIFPNDIILKVNGVSVMESTQDEVVAEFGKVGAGEEMRLTLQSCESPLVLKQVELVKTDGSFGIQLLESGEVLRVGAIAPDSAAEELGVDVGDVLISVNGVRVESVAPGARFDEFMAVFVNTDSVELVLEADPSPILRKVTLDRSNGKSLGIQLSDYEQDPGVYILSTSEGGQARATQLVNPGDRIVEINGADSSFYLHEEAVTAITSEDTVTLMLRAGSLPADVEEPSSFHGVPVDDRMSTTSFSKPNPEKPARSVELKLTGDQRIGIELETQGLSNGEFRHRVKTVVEGSLAASNGIVVGDWIVGINGTPSLSFESPADVISASVSANKSVTFLVA